MPDFANTTAFTFQEVEALVEKFYGIKGKLKKLDGEVDLNFYIQDPQDQEYTLKISSPDTDEGQIDLQYKMTAHLIQSGFPLQIPTVIKTNSANDFEYLDENWIIRLQKWVPGRMLSLANPKSVSVLQQWGKTAGLLSRHLQGFDHPAAHRFYKWDPSECLYSRKYREYIRDEKILSCVDSFWQKFETEALPKLANLRKSVNYNDAHQHNLLTDHDYKNPSITGVIDFGDALFTHTVNELAIACAYAAMQLADPVEAMVNVVEAYHLEFPLEEAELEILFYLITGRLLITVANASKYIQTDTDNDYLYISLQPAIELLFKLQEISPSFVHYCFRAACQFEPCPARRDFNSWIKKSISEIKPVMEFSISSVAPIDLSVSSLELGNNSNFENYDVFEKRIRYVLEEKNAHIGMGGYGEVRPFYSTEEYKTEGNSGAQWRTIHLGMDIWSESGAEVFSPLEGQVFAVKNNEGIKNYGPTLILKHQLDDNFSFYTLYGHLGIATLSEIEEGMQISCGQKIGELGAAEENGKWPPHLHFQIILDMLGNKDDFPGVAYPSESNTWMNICPDPAAFFPIIEEKQKSKGSEQILKIRNKNLGKSLSISYKEPLHIVRGYKQYLFDINGQKYLDTVNNVPHVGHQHPRIVKAAQSQIAVLNTNTRYLHENIVRYSEELLSTFPEELSVVYFVNSGSEATELALRMVESYNGQKDMLAVEAAYHGNTSACIGISSYKFDGRGGKGAPSSTHVLPLPDVYRGLYREPDSAGSKYASHAFEIIKKLESEGKRIGGFICESILSCGGQIVLPENYLKEVYDYVHKAGGLCIADEVQVGFGRVGEKFWGFELQNVIPDIVTLGKPMGNGHPLAAVVTTEEVARSFANGMEYFNTFGGNPVSCAIGREMLNIIQDERLQSHAKEVGEFLKSELRKLQEIFPIIGDVRGHGLFLGFELMKGPTLKIPAPQQAQYLVNRMKQRKILMSTDGPQNNVIKIKPPLCFNKSNVDFLIKNLKQILAEDYLVCSI